MAQIPSLDNAPLNLTPLREQSLKDLLNILKNIRGRKLLVIDQKLSGSLALITQTSILKEHGVENLRHLSKDPIQGDARNVVYLVRSQANLMKLISSNIQQDIAQGLERDYFIYFVPRRTVVCEKVLEVEKVHQLLTIGEYPLYLIPLDEDVLSFELDMASREIEVDGDTSATWHIAKGIHKLESSFGVIPNIRAKGRASTRIADILERMHRELPIALPDSGLPEINTVVLLDREVDMVTPMCSQLTYEGLLDEFLHINNGSVELEASTMGAQGGKRMKSSFGVIPNIRAKGRASTRIADILERMHRELPIALPDSGLPEINTVVLLDREVDMVTPMCSQLTYEGLLDEFLHINNGSVELEASTMGAQGGKRMKVPLNSSDKLYKEIRDLNFEVVVQVLRQKATSMKEDYTEVTTTSQTVAELKDFVKKLNSLPEMTRHINLAQHLTTFTTKPSFLGKLDIEHTIVEGQSYDICFEYIEEMIHKQEPMYDVLRLLVLFSVTNSGLPKKHFDYFRREILHSYGFEHMTTLYNLERAGLLKKQETKSNWLTVKRILQLVVEDTDTANPTDIAYVFSGYAPLSIRLVQHAVRSGWRTIDDILKLLPGPHVEFKRDVYSNGSSLDLRVDTSSNVEKVADGRRSLVLVIFVGGVTFAEISALRFLSAQEGMAYELIVGTTKIINGKSLLETFTDTLMKI